MALFSLTGLRRRGLGHALPTHVKAWQRLTAPVATLGLVLAGISLIPATALAQSESYLLGPGSNIGPATTIKPTNCKTAADGTITCDTKVVNPKGDTPAKPQYSPFNH